MKPCLTAILLQQILTSLDFAHLVYEDVSIFGEWLRPQSSPLGLPFAPSGRMAVAVSPLTHRKHAREHDVKDGWSPHPGGRWHIL